MNKSVTIIGAGPTGLSCAYYFSEKGYRVTVIENSNQPGGLAKGVEFNNEYFDLGPHSFYSNYSNESIQLFKKFIGKNNYTKTNINKIVATKRSLFSVPFKIKDIFRKKNFFFFVSYFIFRQKYISKKITKPYISKYFGLPKKEISTLFEELLYDNTENSDNTLYTPASSGTFIIWKNLYYYLQKEGVLFKFNTSISKFKVEDNHIKNITLNTKESININKIISTIPLKHIYSKISGKTWNFNLDYRSSILIYMDVKSIKTDALYYTNYDPNNALGRINFSSNWKKSSKNNVITLEFWCNEHDDIFSSDEKNLKSLAINSIKSLSFIKPNDNPNFKIIRIQKCFPILTKGYEKELNKINSELEKIKNLRLAGRHGNFKWDGVNDSINRAIELANE